MGCFFVFSRKHYLCISAPAIPLPPQPPTPGPGQYDLVDYMGPGKEYSSSSVFKSTTNRWTFKKSNNGPGPGLNLDLLFIKYSFTLNTEGFLGRRFYFYDFGSNKKFLNFYKRKFFYFQFKVPQKRIFLTDVKTGGCLGIVKLCTPKT